MYGPDSNLPYARVASYILRIQGMATLEVVEGDLLDQRIEVIVNALNRNLLPWWLLLPQRFQGRSRSATAMRLSASWNRVSSRTE